MSPVVPQGTTRGRLARRCRRSSKAQAPTGVTERRQEADAVGPAGAGGLPASARGAEAVVFAGLGVAVAEAAVREDFLDDAEIVVSASLSPAPFVAIREEPPGASEIGPEWSGRPGPAVCFATRLATVRSAASPSTSWRGGSPRRGCIASVG